MKIFIYLKSKFVDVNMFNDKLEHGINYEVNSFTDELRAEVIKNTELGKSIKENLPRNDEIIKMEFQKRLWIQILTKSKNSEYLFLRLNFSIENFHSLIESAKELKMELEAVLNLYLTIEKITEKARTFSKTHKSDQSISEEKFVETILNHEPKRLALLNEIKKLVKVIHIDSDCSPIQLEKSILKEIKAI